MYLLHDIYGEGKKIKGLSFLQVYGWRSRGLIQQCVSSTYLCRAWHAKLHWRNHRHSNCVFKPQRCWYLAFTWYLGTWEIALWQRGIFWEEKQQSMGVAHDTHDTQGQSEPPGDMSDACILAGEWQPSVGWGQGEFLCEHLSGSLLKTTHNMQRSMFQKTSPMILTCINIENHYSIPFFAVEIFHLLPVPLLPVFVKIAATVFRLFSLLHVVIFHSESPVSQWRVN